MDKRLKTYRVMYTVTSFAYTTVEAHTKKEAITIAEDVSFDESPEMYRCTVYDVDVLEPTKEG